jgi:hypothetical protein
MNRAVQRQLSGQLTSPWAYAIIDLSLHDPIAEIWVFAIWRRETQVSVWRVWQSAEVYVDNVKGHCVFRERMPG